MSTFIQKPVSLRELEQHFKSRGPNKESPIALERRFHIAADSEPKISTRLQRVERGDGQPYWEVIVEIDGVRAGGRALPAALKGQATKIEERQVSEELLARHRTGYIPDHLGFNATPQE